MGGSKGNSSRQNSPALFLCALSFDNYDNTSFPDSVHLRSKTSCEEEGEAVELRGEKMKGVSRKEKPRQKYEEREGKGVAEVSEKPSCW